MAVTSRWDEVEERLRSFDRFAGLRPTIAAMFGLVAKLREDARLADVEPGVSHMSLTLRLPGVQRYVIAGWNQQRAPPQFDVSFIDPGFELTQTRAASEAEVVATILEYLDQLSRSAGAT